MIELLNDGWIFQIAPLRGESLGHYLGRFRRANCLSQSALAELMLMDARLLRGLEMPSLGQPLNAEQLKKLVCFLRLSETELAAMLPPVRSQLHLATRLCPKCYAEEPIHRQAWQRTEVKHCDRHNAPLLTACPACYTTFRLPALWENGCCECCWLPFHQMHPFDSDLHQLG
ncbi:TniQ family protein [Leptolyngbya sp. NIES-2104]|uniref:TniQ family protein n=1 Tax=Leptolyngbya sp. NIES-2104 TaxID=1552121 RepID=UPI000A5D5B9A|nr:TniQ family protein [Leptolyngbya sp. NIES-2104]